MRAPAEYADITADVLARIRSRAPRVHCITNSVAQAYTANMLLAAGAIPSMTISPEEIAAFVAGADALLVNLGTFDAERRTAIDVALGALGQKDGSGKPWVLDPVFIERSPARAQFAQSLVSRKPAAVRLNHHEFAALVGGDAAGDTPARFAKRHDTVVALTGTTDVVTDGERSAKIANGDALMGLVTAMGCAGSALVAAALAVERDRWRATIAALVALGVAGEVAAENTSGPGRFASWIIDALHGLDSATLRARTRVSECQGS
jgi:hydroxyethylthiazole kinase